MSSSTPTFAPDVHYDVVFFLSLLKQSLSLDLTEKIRVIESMPTLSNIQVISLHKSLIEKCLQFIHLANLPKGNNINIYEVIQGIMLENIEQWQEIEQFYDLPPLLSDDELVKGIHDFLIAHPDILENIKNDDKISPYLSYVGIFSNKDKFREVMDIFILELTEKLYQYAKETQEKNMVISKSNPWYNRFRKDPFSQKQYRRYHK